VFPKALRELGRALRCDLVELHLRFPGVSGRLVTFVPAGLFARRELGGLKVVAALAGTDACSEALVYELEASLEGVWLSMSPSEWVIVLTNDGPKFCGATRVDLDIAELPVPLGRVTGGLVAITSEPDVELLIEWPSEAATVARSGLDGCLLLEDAGTFPEVRRIMPRGRSG
jgi:hypothetical protein